MQREKIQVRGFKERLRDFAIGVSLYVADFSILQSRIFESLAREAQSSLSSLPTKVSEALIRNGAISFVNNLPVVNGSAVMSGTLPVIDSAFSYSFVMLASLAISGGLFLAGTYFVVKSLDEDG